MRTKNDASLRTLGYYQITVSGKIDASWSDWLEGMHIQSHTEADGLPVTTLSGTINDQAALRGILNRLCDLNLVLRSVQQLNPSSKTSMV